MYELGNRVKGVFGVALAVTAGVASIKSFCGVMNFDNLGLINVVKMLLSLLPIVYVTMLVPKEVEITEALRELERSRGAGSGGLSESPSKQRRPTLAEPEDNPIATQKH